MSEVIPFDFEQHRVRVITRDAAPWFVLADVCRALGLPAHRRSFSHHADKLDDDEKRLADGATILKASPGLNMGLLENGFSIMGAVPVSATDPLAHETAVWLISESGLYTLILRCRDAAKPGTPPRRFRTWVTSEVLPAIRKTGSYTVPATAVAQAASPPGIEAGRNTFSPEEWRTNISALKEYRLMFGVPGERWMAGYLGMPIPPAELLDANTRQLHFLADLDRTIQPAAPAAPSPKPNGGGVHPA